MMITKWYISVPICMLMLPIKILAQDAASRSAAIDAIASGTLKSAQSENKLGDHQLPKLIIHWQCSDCNGNTKIIPLIEREYEKYAHEHHYTISDAETADAVITDYHQRNPAMRATLGAMAGNDVLATNVAFRGQTFIADDYSANAWLGMNHLCGSVATEIFKKTVSILKQIP